MVVNCEKIKVTGNKLLDKKYYRHSGWVGSLKETSLADMLARHPERVISLAVRLGRAMLKRLKVYVGDNHPHLAQKPQPLELPYQGK